MPKGKTKDILDSVPIYFSVFRLITPGVCFLVLYLLNSITTPLQTLTKDVQDIKVDMRGVKVGMSNIDDYIKSSDTEQRAFRDKIEELKNRIVALESTKTHLGK